jgi:FMN reductase
MIEQTPRQRSIVGIGGTLRSGSSTEKIVRAILAHAEALGARVTMFAGPELAFPMYEPGTNERGPAVSAMIAALRDADAVVVGSPGYHGSVSGLIKNALDYTEDMSADPRPYFHGRPVGCVATGAGWQGANGTLVALRQIVHSLRGWPSPLGIAANSREPLFDGEGNCMQSELQAQIEAMAIQLLEFRV